MAWYHQATSHYLSQWWCRSVLSHDIAGPQWVYVVHVHWAFQLIVWHHIQTTWLRPQYIFSCNQAAVKTLLSCRLSSRPSVHHTFFTMFLWSYHPEIFRSYHHWQTWCSYKRPTSEVNGRDHRGQSNFCPNLGFTNHNSSLNSQMSTKWCT